MEYKKVKIKDWEEYEVDTNGIIYKKNGTPMKYSINYKGYCIVNFYSNHIRKGFQVHVLVANTFIPNPSNKSQVNHKDGNKLNNSVDNLEWVTPSENIRHSFDILNRKANNERPIIGYDKNTYEICYRFNSIADGARYFAEEFDISEKNCKTSIWRALSGKRKTYKECFWKYS